MNRSLSGRLEGSEELDLRNYTLPSITHIPQKVFKAVYALDQQDMTPIDGDAWDEVQDRLLGGLSIDYIRPARGVIEALETDAKTLWRTDRRKTKPLPGRASPVASLPSPRTTSTRFPLLGCRHARRMIRTETSLRRRRLARATST